MNALSCLFLDVVWKLRYVFEGQKRFLPVWTGFAIIASAARILKLFEIFQNRCLT